MTDNPQGHRSSYKYFEKDEDEGRGEVVLEAKGRVLIWHSAYCILLGLAFRSGAKADSYACVIGF
jgi:hypothetical protein